MPLTPTNYLNSVIYKIEHETKPELIYVGSTTNFIKRKATHKSACNIEKVKEHNLKLYDMMRLNGGWDAFKCMIIKEFPCNNKTELLIEEERHRKEYQATLNKNRAYITKEETKERNKITKKEYYETNKQKIKETTKGYYQVNKKEILEYQHNYYNKINKLKILDKMKNYYQLNKKERIEYQKDWYQAKKLKNLIIPKEEPILTGSPTETETDDEESDEPQFIEPQIIEVLGNGVKFEIQIY